MTIAEHFVTGSLTNEVLARQTKNQPIPKVGMGVTLLGWTDRYAGTITEISGGVVTVQEDRSKRIDKNGRSDQQTYEYAPNPDGMVSHYRLDDGVWTKVEFNDRTERWDKTDGYGLVVGLRQEFYDYSF